MKALLLILAFCPVVALAQKVDVKDIDTENSETTLVEIRKGKQKEVDPKAGAVWEVHEGSDDIEGEPAPLVKDARASWSDECKNWKKEFKENNKENKIISMSCGKAVCEGGASGKTCISKATYKIKTKIN